MITSREVANAANEWQLRHDVVEKDYMLGWLLSRAARALGGAVWYSGTTKAGGEGRLRR